MAGQVAIVLAQGAAATAGLPGAAGVHIFATASQVSVVAAHPVDSLVQAPPAATGGL